MKETEIKKCNKCNESFEIDQDEFSFYEKMKVPVPNICPDCRFKIRALWRNETTLYSGQKCVFCNKSIITMYNPKSSYIISCRDCYNGDGWDPKSYAIDYNKSKTFLEQLKELFVRVPKLNLYATLSSGPIINSDYISNAGGAKNCYFLFNGGSAEETLYSRGVRDCRELCDAYFGVNIEQCYETVNVNQSNKIDYGQNIVGCVDSYFIYNCSNLVNCFGCVNLRNKSNYWFNEKISKEEYEKRINEFKGNYKIREKYIKEFLNFKKQFPHKENNNLKTIDSTGDYLFECKNIKDSFEVTKGENCKYIFSGKKIKDSMGIIGFGFQSELLLECVSTGYSSKIIASYCIDQSSEVSYSMSCYHNNKNLFGCDSIKNSQYCILNKQYSKEEYEELKEYIIKELTEQGIYGLMMPPELSLFAYNETIAQDNMPLTKKEALAQGFRWEDNIQMTMGKETLLPENIPDHIKDVKDEITKEVLKCISCERNYKITEQELLFYRKMILPIPRKCFYCRHKDRVIRRGPFKFFVRKCSNCNKDVNTNLTEEVAPILYCEKCYQQEVI
ncbi:hypothetical protein COX93_03310 [Candidatus Nomurabacteria bacterium CG_4_10_14_0_2_um_filter_30_12]|uniref:Uncharacterized protein n=1 Tax=Candidatus Nomurabacteria bacterium CG_4_10_14_0_2_um_filter_30_12 TaxID=1974727 RepID=A0A2J0MEV8_9BACT|nr:MAG: hypothetical protein COX93_03310 [Candidatus Nomurabacteria bacterium CG_4_10_14_0_2_um_filter_30_12]